MRIKHVKNDPQSMSHDGGKILKSLQNDSMPLIDIIVREAIQNSLDASLENRGFTDVSFNIGEFSSTLLAPHFEEICESLLEWYPGNQNYMAIRDTNTSGLTGEYKIFNSEDLDKSNFHKLVFSIGKNQEQEGAGGSWGYGKTSYFRLGIGLIIYYTRIKTESAYEERLIASMIEDPKKEKRLLTKNDRGIAWWGEPSGDEFESIYPVTDDIKINEILNIFSIKRYEANQTGTTIIIPYVPEKKPEIIDSDTKIYPWEETYEDEINIAIQRWYFPRILNKKYSEINRNSMLLPRVNGKTIDPSNNLEPIFKTYQEIYNAALIGKTNDEEIEIADISFRATKNKNDIIGRVALKEVSKKEMRMLPPENRYSALAYLGEKSHAINEQFNSTVMAYSRRPGMVIEYSIDGRWVPSGINLKDDHILLAFFVPCSFIELSNEFSNQGYDNLESYLRAIETSDHATWDDKVGITIVKRIKSYSSVAINNIYKEAEEQGESFRTSALSRKLGKLFMPPKSFGKSATPNPITKRKKVTNIGGVRSDLIVENTSLLEDGNVIVDIKVSLKANSESEVYLFVNTQERSMDSNSWYKTFEGSINFPFTIENLKRMEKGYSSLSVASDLNTDKISVIYNDESSSFTIRNKNNKIEELLFRFTCCVKLEDLAPSVGIKTIKEGISDE